VTPSIRTLAYTPLFLLAPALCAQGAPKPEKRPNVLFVIVDDLNHWIGALGRNTQTKTPAIDALAKRGVLFQNAYCPAPLCNPSRAAIFSGMRPGTTGVYENSHDWREVVSKEKTLPGVFAQAGYRTVGVGKTYDYKYERHADYEAYAERKTLGRWPVPKAEEMKTFGEPQWGPVDCKDEDTPEYKMVNYAIGELGAQAKKGAGAQPLFLAVGLFRPHAPWFVPRKYYDMHPRENIELPPFSENDLDDLPPPARRLVGEKVFKNISESGQWKAAIQGYLAAVSYADAQLKRLFDELEKHPKLKENTIIVFWGDNGWHLGEKHHFGKYTLWEEATRIPHIWVVPGLSKENTVCAQTMDLMDIYPTLLELCGIARPAHVQGDSIVGLLKNPSAVQDKAAISTYRQNNHSIRKGPWRYTRYANGSQELYNHDDDPYEWKNLAADPAHEKTIAELAAWLPKDNVPAQPVSQIFKDHLARQKAAAGKK